MRYRVAFAKRVQSDGDESAMRPSAELHQNLPEGVVAEKVFIEQESEAQRSQEVLDEDDAFLGSAAPEVWEYEVVDDRAAEFEDAIKKSDLVMEYDVVDISVTEKDDASPIGVADLGVFPADGGTGGDDPAGTPTGDPSAGGLNVGKSNDAGELVHAGSGGIDHLNVTMANDPRLGLTNRGQKPAQDWAANTGPTRNPDWGAKEEAPPKNKKR